MKEELEQKGMQRTGRDRKRDGEKESLNVAEMTLKVRARK